MEVERSLRVLDGSVTVFAAKGGVEPQSETVWRQAEEYGVPRMAYVNKMDIMGADFYNVIDMMKDRLNCTPVPIQLPIGAEDSFRGIIDLVAMTADVYYDEMGKDMRVEEIPEDMREKAEEYHTALIEHVAEQDDALMEKYLSGEEITKDEIVSTLRKATIANKLVVVTCGTSYKNKGVQKLLDAIVDYMPAPTDIPAIRGTNVDTGEEEDRHASDDEPFSALAFKIATDPFVGKLCYFRVYSGKMNAGDTIPQRTVTNVSAVFCRCTQIIVRIWKPFMQAISPQQSALRTRRQAIRSVMRSIRSFWSPWSSRIRLSALQLSRRQRPVRKR